MKTCAQRSTATIAHRNGCGARLHCNYHISIAHTKYVNAGEDRRISVDDLNVGLSVVTVTMAMLCAQTTKWTNSTFLQHRPSSSANHWNSNIAHSRAVRAGRRLWPINGPSMVLACLGYPAWYADGGRQAWACRDGLKQ